MWSGSTWQEAYDGHLLLRTPHAPAKWRGRQEDTLPGQSVAVSSKEAVDCDADHNVTNFDRNVTIFQDAAATLKNEPDRHPTGAVPKTLSPWQEAAGSTTRASSSSYVRNTQVPSQVAWLKVIMKQSIERTSGNPCSRRNTRRHLPTTLPRAVDTRQSR